MSDLAQLATSIRLAFEEVHRRSSSGDPNWNPNLIVEVLEPAMVEQTPTLILITPWTISGLMFLADGTGIPELTVGKRRFAVGVDTIGTIGTYASVNLVPDVSGLADQEDARHAAVALALPFQQAVARALQERSVADPTRRDLFKRLGGTST